jgi:hypothetical protein
VDYKKFPFFVIKNVAVLPVGPGVLSWLARL